jgi:hypothetical protein
MITCLTHILWTQEYVAEHGDYEKLEITKVPSKGSDDENFIVLYENFALSVFAVFFSWHIQIELISSLYLCAKYFADLLHSQFKPNFELDLFRQTFEMIYAWLVTIPRVGENCGSLST